jgi:hypothetical protein
MELNGTIDSCFTDYGGSECHPSPVGMPFRFDVTFDPKEPFCMPEPNMLGFQTEAQSLRFGGNVLNSPWGFLVVNGNDQSVGPCFPELAPGFGWTIGGFQMFGGDSLLITEMRVSYDGSGPIFLTSRDGDIVTYVGSFWGIIGSGQWSVNPSPVPEPASGILALAGLAGLALKRRKRDAN